MNIMCALCTWRVVIYEMIGTSVPQEERLLIIKTVFFLRVYYFKKLLFLNGERPEYSSQDLPPQLAPDSTGCTFCSGSQDIL